MPGRRTDDATMRTPLIALGYGLVAGAMGAFGQSLFFKATGKLAPKPPEGAFDPPEPEQASEKETETVARRTVQKLMQRGPVRKETLSRGGELVHFGFGAMWGGVYALGRESLGRRPGPGLIAGYGAFVWAVSDNLILPSFRLAAWPTAYPLRSHAYALAAHLAYGAAVGAAYEALRSGALGEAGWALYMRGWRGRRLPSFARGWLGPAANGASKIRRARRRVERGLRELRT
jgi:hypothetical protein